MRRKKSENKRQKVPVKRAKKAAKKPRKSIVPKPYNGGKWTEAMFFQFLRRTLRRASMYWSPINNVRKKAQVAYKGSNKRRKFSYICSSCGDEFSSKEINVHHKIPCGSLNSFEDLPEFAKKLFVEEEGLCVLCIKCHDKIHE